MTATPRGMPLTLRVKGSNPAARGVVARCNAARARSPRLATGVIPAARKKAEPAGPWVADRCGPGPTCEHVEARHSSQKQCHTVRTFGRADTANGSLGRLLSGRDLAAARNRGLLRPRLDCRAPARRSKSNAHGTRRRPQGAPDRHAAFGVVARRPRRPGLRATRVLRRCSFRLNRAPEMT